MTLEDFLNRLEGVESKHGYHTARCPAHDDNVQSLSVKEEDDKLLLKCHAGCEVGDILGALELRWDTLFAEGTENGLPSAVEAVYPYVDEQGELLFEVCRFPGKKFRQRRPDGQWGLGDTRRVLYELPEVLSAEEIYLVEGEKDADRLNDELGLAHINAQATTAPMGAGKWRDEYTQFLVGKAVTIVADADDAGRKYADEVATALDGKATAVRVVLPAVGKDAHDHFEAGHGLEDFLPRDSFTRTYGRLSVVKAATVTPKDVEWMDEEQVVPIGGLTLLQGMPGLGKSTWCCWQAARVSQTRYVLFSSLEDPWTSVLRPRLEAAGANIDNVGFLQCDDHPGFGIPTDFKDLEAIIRDTGARFLVVDPLMGHLSRSIDTYRDHDVRKGLTPLAQMGEKYGCGIVVIHHLNKNVQDKDPMMRGGGSLGGFMGAIRSGLMFEVTEGFQDHDQYRTLKQFKNSWGRVRIPQGFMIKDTVTGGFHTSVIEPIPSMTTRPIGGTDVDRERERGTEATPEAGGLLGSPEAPGDYDDLWA